MGEGQTENPEISGLVDTIQTGAEEPSKEAVKVEAVSESKTWQKLAPGELPKVGEKVKCRDGEGIVERVEGPNVLTKLDTGYLNYGGIDQVLVMR